MADLELSVKGVRYSGWQAVRVTRSLEQLAASFTLQVTDSRKAGEQQLPILEGDACSVIAHGTTIVSGFVEDVDVSYSDTSHTFTVSGRSKAGDLVDCAAEFESGSWSKAWLTTIAKDLCTPFGIGVSAAVDAGEPFEKFTIHPGEPVFDALERAARFRGLLVTSQENGDIVFTKASTTRIKTALKLGENILTGSLRASSKERFSRYTVKAQTQGNDETSGTTASQVQGSAEDEGVGRHRPLVVLAEDHAAEADAQKRAEWERNVRSGRARRVSYTVQGWKHAAGVWSPNTLVPVDDSFLGIQKDLLLVSVVLVLDEQGTRSELELTSPSAFDVLATPEATL